MATSWNLDDLSQFALVLSLQVPWASTWADMREGKTDRERREQLRLAAVSRVREVPSNPSWWALRIEVRKAGRRPFDIENVSKIIVDAFCARQIERDGSQFVDLGFYPDDSIDHVRLLHVYGERSGADSTTIELFAFVG